MKKIMNCLLLFTTIIAPLMAQSPIKKLDNKGIENTKKWKKIFHKDITFNTEQMYSNMVIIHPQPKEKLIPYRETDFNEIFHKSRWGVSHNWFERVFVNFFNPHLNGVNPSHVYLPKGKEASFLYYKWSKCGYNFEMYESFNGLLIRIKPDDLGKIGKISMQKISNILADVVNFENSLSTIPDFFRLESKSILKPGSIFANTDHRSQESNGTQNYMVGFLTEEDICIIQIKKSSNMQMEGLIYKNDWLLETQKN